MFYPINDGIQPEIEIWYDNIKRGIGYGFSHEDGGGWGCSRAYNQDDGDGMGKRQAMVLAINSANKRGFAFIVPDPDTVMRVKR